MKKSAFKITIPEPCHENWQAMTPEAKGRFCQKCAKTVHDFSNKTDRQIAKVYQENEGKVCGRFHKNQLNRRIAPYEPTPKVGHWTVAGMILSGVLSVGQMDGQNCSSNIKGKIAVTEKVEEPLMIVGEVKMNQTITISGKMMSDEKEPITGGLIKVIGADFAAITNENGDYLLEIPRDYEHKEVVVEFSAFGFKSQMELVNWAENGSKAQDIFMEKLEMLCMPEDFHSYLVGDITFVPNDDYGVMGFAWPIPVKENSLLDDAKQLLKDTKERLIEKRNRVNPKLNPQTPQPKTTEIPDFIAPNPIIPPLFIQKIFPNPFVDYLKIEIHAVQNETLEFVLYDVNGRAIFSQKNEVQTGTNLIEMDFGHLNLLAGNYFLSVFQKGEIVKTEMVLKTDVMQP